MANWSDLKAAVSEVIKTNGNQEITGQILQNVLNSIISNLGENATFIGIATPETSPGTLDSPVFYFATQPGIYSNFGGLEIKNTGLAILYNKIGTWQTLLVYETATEEGDSNQITMSQKAITNSLKKARAMALYNRIVLFGDEAISFTKGGFIGSDGQVKHVSGGDYGYSDLIFLPKNGTYVITHQASNNSYAVVFDENLDVVEAHHSGTGYKTTITTGEDDRYLVISNNFSMVANPEFEHSNSIYDTAIEDLKYLSERYLQYSAYYNSNAANEIWYENGYYGANGSVVENENYSYCKAPLNNRKYVFIDHCNIPSSGLIGIVFFNEDAVMLAQVVTLNGTSFTITAPNGATHYGYSKLKTNTKATSYTAPFAGAIGGKIFASLLKNFDADELISKMNFSKISDPEYSEIMRAVSVNSVLSEYSVQYADYSVLGGYMGANNVVGGTLKVKPEENWRVQIINNNNNNILVTGIDIAPDGHILYVALDENDNIIEVFNETELTHIDKKVIYATKAAKIAINRRVTTAFEAQLVNFSFVKTIDFPMLSDNVLSLFPSKEVEPTINWITGELYKSVRGDVASLPVWRRCKEPIPSNATKISINHINVAVTGKVVVLFWGDDPDTVLDAVIADSNSEDYSAEVPIAFGAKYWGINSRTTNNNVKVTFSVVTQDGSTISDPEFSEITVENSDKIAIIGDSYTESHYTVKGKAYINKMSLFSDYVFMNFAKSGDVYNGRLYDIRQNTPIYGNVPFAKYRPKFTMMCCYTNDIKVMNTNQFLECLQNIINVTKGLGTEPIVCTEYHTGSTNDSKIGVRSGLEDVARKNGLMFWDIASYVDLIRGSKDYAPFWGGSHPGSRTNAIQSDNYEKYLLGLERPAKSIKLFRPRNTDISDLDNLMFNTNYERAKLFKEIFVGHSALNNSALVDNCTNAVNSKVESEYQKLIEKTALSFTSACLISAVVPVLADTLSYLALNLKNHTGSVKVYVRNSMAPPYPSNTRYTRFDYTNLIITPNIGDIYTASNDSNVKQFTVVGIVEGIGDGDAKGVIFCSPADTSTNAGGTLTRVSGSGDASIPYSYRAVGYLQGDLAKDTGGHWVEISQDESGIYPIPADLIGSSVYTDRVDFLVVCESGDFTISDLSIRYNNGVSKGYHRSIIPFETNYINDNEELLPSNTFETVGVVDSNWNVTPTDIYEHQNGTNTYPVGCSSKVDVTDTVSLEYTIPTSKIKNGSRKAILEIWCRYFPSIYSDGTGDQITENSFDYNEIKVDIGVKKVSTLSEKVNTHWKIVRFPIKLVKVGTQGTKVKIYSDTKGIEVVYVSLKYE